MQRYGVAVTSGRVASTWQMLSRSVTHMLRYALAGSPYYAGDVGGSLGDVDEQLLVRWYQAAAFFPIMRVHNTHDGASRFPTDFSEPTLARLRAAVQLRYQMLPLLRSLAYELAFVPSASGSASAEPSVVQGHLRAEAQPSGLPSMRPMLMMYPEDARFAKESSQWMVGDRLLVAPQITSSSTREVALPVGTWFSFNSTQTAHGPADATVSPSLDEILVLVRAGSVFAVGDSVMATADAPQRPLLLHIYPGSNATFVMREDDGVTLDGDARVTTFIWDDADLALLWSAEGSYSGNTTYTLVQAVAFFPDADPVYSRVRDIGDSGFFTFAAARAAANAAPAADSTDSAAAARGGDLRNGSGEGDELVPYRLSRQ